MSVAISPPLKLDEPTIKVPGLGLGEYYSAYDNSLTPDIFWPILAHYFVRTTKCNVQLNVRTNYRGHHVRSISIPYHKH